MGTNLATASPAVRADASVLAAAGITKSYRRGVWPLRRRQPVLRGADLALRPGEVVGLVGENGSGKSTLMTRSSGYSSPSAGRPEAAC